MSDPRVKKLAEVLVHYSLAIQPGQKVGIRTSPLAEPLTLAVYAEALKGGAYIDIFNDPSAIREIFYKHASEAQLQHVSPVNELVLTTYDAVLFISADSNKRALSSIAPRRLSMTSKAHESLRKFYFGRTARGEFTWCLTAYPTEAAAQEADMSLSEYQDFVYAFGKVDDPNPIASWQAESKKMHQLKNYLERKDKIILKGADIDLKFSIKGRTFEVADGKQNFPDGEIFTAPLEDSVNGWVRYRYPAIYNGREVEDIELWFEGGRVVKYVASKGKELLTSMLETDDGAKILGEWGIGTNYSTDRFTKEMLFDEKLGGTIHFAVGKAYPETGGLNESAIHWDMLCDMSESEMLADGELFYKDGRPLMWD